jgi:hypothetical protein
MKKYLWLLPIIVGCSYDPCCYLSTQDITDMYTVYVEEWKKEVKVAFDDAEQVIFQVKPKPDDVVGPDKDPAKCICKGTGIIVQGDGHKTPCPFHSKASK